MVIVVLPDWSIGTLNMDHQLNYHQVPSKTLLVSYFILFIFLFQSKHLMAMVNFIFVSRIWHWETSQRKQKESDQQWKANHEEKLLLLSWMKACFRILLFHNLFCIWNILYVTSDIIPWFISYTVLSISWQSQIEDSQLKGKLSKHWKNGIVTNFKTPMEIQPIQKLSVTWLTRMDWIFSQ